MRSRKELADAVRILSMDAVDKAKSGHPGAPMGMADMAEALWRGVLRHNPANPHWANRDRFVLSNGHASMLLYEPAAPDRLRPEHGRHQGLPPARFAHARPS